jgi:hypothetical protein
LGAQEHTLGEQVAEDAGEYMDVELLVGPVVLGAQGQMEGVLEMGEDGFDLRLSVVGINDLGGGPVVAVRDQDDPAQGVTLECRERRLVEFVGEREVGILPGELEG